MADHREAKRQEAIRIEQKIAERVKQGPVKPVPHLCECGELTRHPLADLCVECSRSRCMLASSRAWRTENRADKAIALRRRLPNRELVECPGCWGMQSITIDASRVNDKLTLLDPDMGDVSDSQLPDASEIGLAERSPCKGYDVLVDCPGVDLDQRLGMFNAAGCPGRTHQATFETYECVSIPLDLARKNVQQWAESVDPHSPHSKGRLLYGPPGTGKTHLLVAAIKYLTIKRGIVCKYVDWSRLTDDLRKAVSRNDTSPDQILAPLESAPVLVIDELGKGRLTDFRYEHLDRLVSVRYERPDTVTAFATNVSGELTESMAKPLVSRLTQMAKHVGMRGEDYRAKL